MRLERYVGRDAQAQHFRAEGRRSRCALRNGEAVGPAVLPSCGAGEAWRRRSRPASRSGRGGLLSAGAGIPAAAGRGMKRVGQCAEEIQIRAPRTPERGRSIVIVRRRPSGQPPPPSSSPPSSSSAKADFGPNSVTRFSPWSLRLYKRSARATQSGQQRPSASTKVRRCPRFPHSRRSPIFPPPKVRKRRKFNPVRRGNESHARVYSQTVCQRRLESQWT